MTNCSSRALRSSSNDSTAFQNHFTMLLSGVQCLSRVLDFQSLMSILPRPHTISYTLKKTRRHWGINKVCMDQAMDHLDVCKQWSTSSSFSSKAFSRCWGMTSLKPFCSARNWASMPRKKRQLTYSRTYSFLVSWVTGMLLPLGLSSC